MYPWHHHRRFNAYLQHFRAHFGERVQKVTIDAGFTCPNRDGSKAYGGCTYCSNDAFNPSYCQPEKPITQQIREGISFHEFRYRRANKYIAYFQPYSNTYAPLEKLKELYNEALKYPGIVGLIVGTRPDCIDEEKLEYFRELSKDHYILIEYGLESCYDKTLKRVNRQHTFAQSVEALEMTAKYGLKSGVHMIFGLPGESIEEMMKEADILSGLPILTIKFHQLQIFKNTPMEREFRDRPDDFVKFSLEEYIDFIIDFIERLNPAIMIERFAGEVPLRYLVQAPWSNLRYDEILRLIEEKLEQRDTWQGRLFSYVAS